MKMMSTDMVLDLAGEFGRYLLPFLPLLCRLIYILYFMAGLTSVVYFAVDKFLILKVYLSPPSDDVR